MMSHRLWFSSAGAAAIGASGACAALSACLFVAPEHARAPSDAGRAASHERDERAGDARRADEPAPRFTDADFERHVEQLKRRLPHDGFTIIIEKPFVVIGDESPAMVKRRAEGTVRWAVDHLTRRYFRNDPLHILDVWLFKDRQSYEKHHRELFGGDPGTPFGFYSARHRALVMNIATGGGTLVHEIVHPFIEANFPDCPPWFNEGLGSLYEQCDEQNGVIRGLTNWRLAGLKRSIERGDLPTFEALCAMKAHSFYSSGGDNYAQARYLLYYLQERGLLLDFYQRFTAGVKNDPTGYASLRAVLGEDGDDMAAFQKRWAEWVMKLTFP